jgi:hypothetical protein
VEVHVRIVSGRRLAPVVAGFAGLGWFWAELAPQRLGFEDTDDPRVSLEFLAADETAWPMAGLFLATAAIALIPTVLAMRDRLTTATASLAAMFFAMAVIRMAGGPVRYVQGLDQSWGETAYLVTQFVGVHLAAQAGGLMLAAWIAGTAWLGARRRVIPIALAMLGIVPALRLLVILGPFASGLGDGLWLFLLAGIPVAFVWLVLLGLTRQK